MHFNGPASAADAGRSALVRAKHPLPPMRVKICVTGRCNQRCSVCQIIL